MKRNFQACINPSPSANVSRHTTALLSLILLFAPATLTARAQETSKIRQELENKRAAEVKNSAPPAAAPRTPTKTTARRSYVPTRGKRVKTSVNHARKRGPRNLNNRGGGYREPAQPKEFSVTFMTDVAGADIALNGMKIGTTGEDKTLQANVTPGRHKATASHAGYNTQAMIVSAKSDGETFPFYFGNPVTPPTPTAVPVAAATPTPRPTPPPPSAEEVMRRFVDPAGAEKLTPDDWREVVTQSEKDLDREPTNAQSKARLHLGRGQIAFLGKNYPEALTQFTSAARELPGSGFSYYALGNTYLARNQYPLAAQMFQRAIRLSPDVAVIASKKLGDAQSKMGKTKEANASYVRARQLGYSSPEMIKGVALNLMRDKQWKQALAEWNALAEKSPSAEVYVNIGECHEKLEETYAAYKAYAAATQIDPNSAVAHAKLGDASYRLKEYREARESYELALKLDATGAQIDRQRTRKQADAAASLSR